jgi:cytidylate kinase
LIVTIDGPAGAGKSSIAREVAERLGFEFLDTGAMYRAVTLGAIRAAIPWDDTDAVARFAAQARLQWNRNRIFLNDQDVTDEIRTPAVTAAIRHVADIPTVRQQLSLQQRRIAEGRKIVTEGRDQGSEVFPAAECKIFLTASPEERARRRQQQLAAAGRQCSLEEILAAQNQRDLEDSGRPVGALRAAPDAVVIKSDRLTPEQVVQRILQCVQRSMSQIEEPH